MTRDYKELIDINRLLEEKWKAVRDEGRLHQFEQATMAEKFAHAAIKAVLVLSAGALALIPTFIAHFDLKTINWAYLYIAMVSFIASIASALLVQLFAYLSCSAGAYATLKSTEAETYTTGIRHYREYAIELPTEWEGLESTAKSESEKLDKWGTLHECIAIGLGILSILGFTVGATVAVLALPYRDSFSPNKQIVLQADAQLAPKTPNNATQK